MGDDWIDLCKLLDRTEYRIPAAMRDPGDTMGHCGSLAALYADPAIDPRSGGLLGYPEIGRALGLSQRQTRRILAGPLGECVRWISDVPATNTSTADEIRARHETLVSVTHRNARAGKVFKITS